MDTNYELLRYSTWRGLLFGLNQTIFFKTMVIVAFPVEYAQVRDIEFDVSSGHSTQEHV